MALGHLDWVIIGLYMAGMLAIGFWPMRKIKDCGGYMLGERKLRKWMMIPASFSGGISSNHSLSVASASYQKGFPGAWISLAYMFVMPFYWMFPPVFQRARLVTMVDFLRLRVALWKCCTTWCLFSAGRSLSAWESRRLP